MVLQENQGKSLLCFYYCLNFCPWCSLHWSICYQFIFPDIHLAGSVYSCFSGNGWIENLRFCFCFSLSLSLSVTWAIAKQKVKKTNKQSKAKTKINYRMIFFASSREHHIDLRKWNYGKQIVSVMFCVDPQVTLMTKKLYQKVFWKCTEKTPGFTF